MVLVLTLISNAFSKNLKTLGAEITETRVNFSKPFGRFGLQDEDSGDDPNFVAMCMLKFYVCACILRSKLRCLHKTIKDVLMELKNC